MDERIIELNKTVNFDLQGQLVLIEQKWVCTEELKNILPADSIVVAQASPVSGDVKTNALKAFQWIKWAIDIEADAIVFPEMFLVGYPLGDAISKFPIVVEENLEWLNALATKVIGKTKVVMGFVDKNKTDVGKPYHNSLAVLANGKIETVIHSSVLPKDFIFNDYKYFEVQEFNADERLIDFGNKNAILAFKDELISNDIFETISRSLKPDCIINVSASLSRANDEQLINNALSNLAQNYNLPIVYVNRVGAVDSLVFAGASCVYNNKGEIISKAESFEEQFLIASLSCDGYKSDFPKRANKQNLQEFSLDYEDDLERIYLSIVKAIKDYFSKTGFKRAVLGLSGGLDSTISAVLLADALGPENVYGVSMPSNITSSDSKNDAKLLAQNLGINFAEKPIKELFDCTRLQFDNIFSLVEKDWDCRFKDSFTNDNIQARSRAIILWGIANEFEACLPIATSDKSELYMGYATINGDMSGGFAPLADVTKTKLFALGAWLNKNREIKNAIPQSILNKRPGAELAINPKTGKPLLAEEALMPYEFLDEIIWRVENLNQSADELLQIEFLYEKKMKNSQPVSSFQKSEWINKFFRRMATSIYKSTIMPPFPIVDSVSINSIEYKQPITSKINHFRTSLQDKLDELV